MRDQEIRKDLKFCAWLARVDDFLSVIACTRHASLPGQPWRLWHKNGLSSYRAAKKALKREGW